MQLSYASIYECDSCGGVALVRPPSNIRNITASPKPDGWGCGEIFFPSTASYGTKDICDVCMHLPFLSVIDNIRRRNEDFNSTITNEAKRS